MKIIAMKKSVWKLSFILALLTIVSCNKKDDHSLGAFRINLATVITEGRNSYYLLLDNGKRLWPAASDIAYSPVNNRRVFVNYTTLSDKKNGYDHYIKVNDIWNILTKNTIELTPQNADSIGHDPVRINAVWVGGDYLNIDFMFNYGGIRPHAINLVENKLPLKTLSDTIGLEFRHNAYNSRNKRLYEGFVCFNLKPFRREDADSVKLAIKVKDWKGNKTYNLTYKYNQTGLQGKTLETPIPVVGSNEYY